MSEMSSPLMVPMDYYEPEEAEMSEDPPSPIMCEIGEVEEYLEELDSFHLDAEQPAPAILYSPVTIPKAQASVDYGAEDSVVEIATTTQPIPVTPSTPAPEVKQEVEPSSTVVIGKFFTKVVGNKHCTARVPQNETLILQRDRDNEVDVNAVGVYDGSNRRVGFIPADKAVHFSQILDQGVILTGICPKVNNGTAVTTLILTLSGPFSLLSAVQERFNAAGLVLLDDATDGEVEDVEGKGSRKLFDSAMGEVDLSTLPLCPNPPSKLLRVSLMKHQHQAIEWMRNREATSHSPDPFDYTNVDFWTRRSQTFVNTLTNQRRKQVQLCRGGILADDMGLGKTLSVIALILMDKHREVKVEKGMYVNFATLIVCPLSVMDNWKEQLHSHVACDDLTIYEYHGAENMKVSPALLARHRIILTTYETVSSNYSIDFKSALFKIKYKRIILDEGHNIKTWKKSRAKACYALEAENRWFVSGTPITNALDDFYSILKFLRFQPYDDRKEFIALKKHSDHSVYLRKLVQILSLRRTKAAKINGVPIVDLKECTIVLKKLRYTDTVAWEKYKEIEKEGGILVKGYIEDGEEEKKFALFGFILTIMLRLRQFCDDPSLIPHDFVDTIKAMKAAAVFKEGDEKCQDMMEAADANGDECPMCMEVLEVSTMVATDCSHLFCRLCIEEHLKGGSDKTCPVCRSKASAKNLRVPKLVKKQSAFPNLTTPYQVGPKVEYIVRTLQATPSSIKSIVFSQWTSVLQIIAKNLDVAGIAYCEYDGTMNVDTRNDSLSTFKSLDGPSVMLMSLKCGGVGLNICEASQIFLVDPWWNTSIEQQAIDRCHRIGQLKPVTVYKLVIEDSIEDRVLEIQSSKESLIADMFSSIKGANQSKSTKEEREKDLAYLFNV